MKAELEVTKSEAERWKSLVTDTVIFAQIAAVPTCEYRQLLPQKVCILHIKNGELN